jgi:GntR family transcriptional regulator/MocR family aminotransferase
MAEGHFSRHLKKMRLLYAQRRLVAQRIFQEVLGQRIRIDLQPGGLHLLLKLAAQEDDVRIAERARGVGLGLLPLSSWYIDAPAKRGLLAGFANIVDEKEARRLALMIRQAMADE